jgi:hypothetical protein
MLTKCQNHHHHGDVFDMWTKWDIPQAEWAQELTGPSPWQATRVGGGSTRALVATRLHKEEKAESCCDIVN